ncbi:peptidylprolyl isomerase [Pseudomonas sp. WN033]|nr:peptidylprolyl isomerase [Pseudomonas sp. WN033]
MLQRMRDNAQSWVAKVIVGVIVLIFALTGWESISRFTSNEQKAAEVNGTVISRMELEQAVSLQRRQLIQQIQQLGNDAFDPSMIDEQRLRASVLEGLIERALLIKGATDARFNVSEAMIDQLILATPDFQVGGQFDANRFDVVIRNMGMSSRLAFRDMVRQELLIAQLRNGFEATAFATPAERLHLARLEKQTRDFAVIELKADLDAVEIQDEDIQAYYTANQARFMTPEQVVIESLTLSRSGFFDRVSIDEAAVEGLYQREVGNLAEQRRVAHILIESTGEEGRVRIEAARERLDAGEDFATVAREVSEDPGSANDGGDLGYVVRGSFDQAFDDALFALNEGEVSEPVQTSFGYHLIKLTAIQAPDVPSLESMRDSLEQELKAEQAERLFVEASQELANLAYESPDLVEPARALGLDVITTGPVSRNGGEGVTSSPRVMTAAFDEEVLLDKRNSPLIELDADTAVVVRVKEHLRPEQLPLDEVRDEIADLLRYERAVAGAEQQAAELVSQLRSRDLDGEAVAAQVGSQWQTHEAVSRASTEVAQGLLREVFALARPAETEPSYGHFRRPDGGQWIVRLTGVATPEALESEAESPLYQRFIAGQSGEQDFAAVQQRLREKADIERYIGR